MTGHPKGEVATCAGLVHPICLEVWIPTGGGRGEGGVGQALAAAAARVAAADDCRCIGLAMTVLFLGFLCGIIIVAVIYWLVELFFIIIVVSAVTDSPGVFHIMIN